ncbi:MAG TPA: MFS transporter [Xanthobacteraceae bacterium]|jgi:MFS family permease
MNLRNPSPHEPQIALSYPSGQIAGLPDGRRGDASAGVGAADACGLIDSDVAPRLDRLPWDRFHTLVVVALGITWILDGLEVTMVGSLAGAFEASPVLHFSTFEVGLTGSAYVAGAVLGAIFFGWLTDRLGRKKLFFVTLGVYLAATAATAASWGLVSFFAFRFLTGAGIGGEYTAINSTIQELIPARYRGRTDLAINGTFWIGAALGAVVSIVLLGSVPKGSDWGWRLAFLVGAVLGLVILFMRMWIPESPRWLVTHGRGDEADTIVAGIEARVRAHGHVLPPVEGARVRLRARGSTPLVEVAVALFRTFRTRTLVGLSLMAAQAFFYNAIFFTYALILTNFYSVPSAEVGWYILPFAAGNFFGPLLLGRFFDTIGRKTMIASTYAVSGLLLAFTGYLFSIAVLSAQAQTIAWMMIFFVASAAASSAYLTVGEIFPLEMRALAIAFFYAVGTGIGGVLGPLLFGALIESGSRASVFVGYLIGAALMVAAGAVEWKWGIAAEGQPLEAVARPLAATD